MPTDANLTAALLDWLQRTAWQTAILVALVLLFQRLFRRWLTPRWRHALWWLVLARLVLPATPVSGVSVFNLLPAGWDGGGSGVEPTETAVNPFPPASTAERAPARVEGVPPAELRPAPANLFANPATFTETTAPAPAAVVLPKDQSPSPATGVSSQTDAQIKPVTTGWSWRRWWPWLWLAGAFALAGRITVASFRFHAALRQSRPVRDARTLAVLQECCQRLNVHRPPAVVETECVRSPALAGLVRPRLLLPAGLPSRFTSEELRHVLLHELAHLKRRDIALNWLATALQVLHWFNPAVWVAFRRMRADRELAADALASTALGERQAQPYGQTIIKLLQTFNQPVATPALVGVLEDQRAMRDRMKMIAAFRPPSRWSSLAGLLVVGLGGITLTDALPRQARAAAETADGVAAPPATMQTAEGPQFRPLDLSRFYVTRWDTIKAGTSWDAVPKGRQRLAEVPFDLGGIIELSGLGALRADRQFPTRVEGIPIGGRVGALHLIHGAAYDAPDGTPIGKLVLHYSDGQTRDLPLRYGVHGRNWWVERAEKSAAISDPGSRVAWTGTSPETDANGVTLRLFQTRFVNPRPDQPVQSLDVVSLLTRATPVILAVTVEASGADAGAAAVASAPAFDEAATHGESRLRILAADSGLPIAGATVHFQVADAQATHAFGAYQANHDGRVTLDFPAEGITRFNLLVRAKGYVARRQSIEGSTLPPELVIQLDPGVVIGGVVRDDQGKPVAGAQVRINGVARDAAGQVIEEEIETVETDAQGRWACRSVPSQPQGLSFKVTHPEFLPAEYDQADEAGQGYDVSTKSLLARAAVMTLEPGIAVTGSVLDAEGKTLAGAEVVLASGDELANRGQARTDDNGHFRVVALETGAAALLVQAPGRAPQQRKFQLESGLAPFEFKLAPGRTHAGRVLDEAGKPVAGAVVAVERWQDLDLLKWRAETDVDGRFIWDSAPLDAITLSVSKPGFNRTTLPVGEMVAPELTLRLARTFLFTGRVLDAETGQPITAFRLVRGRVWGGFEEDQTSWQAERDRPLSNAEGTFSLGLDYQSGGRVRFMAVAEGYLPEASPAFDETGWHEHEFKLKKGSGPRGVVVNAAGQPVEGAEVAVLGFGYVALQPGSLRSLGASTVHVAKTDAAGRFSLPALLPNPQLIAVHAEQGFAELSAGELAVAGKIALLPWGRVEGVMKIGSKVAADREVALVNQSTTPSGLQFDFNAYKTRTDAEGRFAFDKVPPGERQLMRPIPFGRGGWSWSHLQRLTVKAGEVTTVTYGGTGRPVIGRVVSSDPTRKMDWASGHHTLGTRFPQPPAELRTPESMRAWQKSPEFKEAFSNQHYYAPTWSEDGSFRIDDVLPGRYQLTLMFMEPGDNFPQTSIGSISRDVEVPEIPGGQTDEPLDLGELKLTLRSQQEISADRARQAEARSRGTSAAGGAQMPTLDGGTFDASKTLNKFVLMTLWSATNDASRAELQLLKQLHAEYAGDDRLLMLGAVADENLETARKLVQELGISWLQLVATAEIKRGLTAEFPDATPPVSFFGRTGDPAKPTPLRGEAVREAVKKALGPPVKSAAKTAPGAEAGQDQTTGAEPAPARSTAIVLDTAPPRLRDINPRMWAAVYSPDGQTIATTAGWDNPSEPGELVLWDVASRQARLVIRQESTIRAAAFSPDGRQLAIGDFAGHVTIFNPTNGAVVKALPPQLKLLNAVVFTPDGRTLASGGFDETVRLWDVETGEARRAFVLPGEGVVSLAISRDGQWLAAGTWPGKVHLWRLDSAEKARAFEAGGGRTVEMVAFSPDGTQLATGGWDGTLRLWSVATGEETRRFTREPTGVMATAFSPDGRLLACSDDRGTVELWQAATGEKIGAISAHSDRCHGLAFSPDGQRLATVGWDRVLRIWNLENRQSVTTFSR